MALKDKVEKVNRKETTLTKLEKISRRTRRDLRSALREDIVDKLLRRLKKK